jgi:hypothetical protein
VGGRALLPGLSTPPVPWGRDAWVCTGGLRTAAGRHRCWHCGCKYTTGCQPCHAPCNTHLYVCGVNVFVYSTLLGWRLHCTGGVQQLDTVADSIVHATYLLRLLVAFAEQGLMRARLDIVVQLDLRHSKVHTHRAPWPLHLCVRACVRVKATRFRRMHAAPDVQDRDAIQDCACERVALPVP